MEDKANKVKEALKEKEYITSSDIISTCKMLKYTTVDTFKIYDKVISDFVEIAKETYKRK